MKRFLAIVILGGAFYAGIRNFPRTLSHAAPSARENQAITAAFRNHQDGIQVSGEGKVVRILSDDSDGTRHQRFILELASGQTLLIAHNIDIAPRIGSLEIGDAVSFKGEYIWNEQGGTVHWTHHDPHGNHAGGWLKKGSDTFQ